MKDYYKILQVNRSANRTDIKRAYRRMCLKTHPDLFSGSEKKAAEERFIEIHEAYDVLSERQKRAAYDDHIRRYGIDAFSEAPAAAAAGEYDSLAKILKDIADMEMPPPYSRLSAFHPVLKKKLQGILAHTRQFNEDVLEIVECAAIAAVGEFNLVLEACLIVTNMRLLYMARDDEKRVQVISVMLTDLRHVRLRPREDNPGAVEFTCLGGSNEHFSVSISRDIITRLMIILKLYHVPIDLIPAAVRQNVFRNFDLFLGVLLFSAVFSVLFLKTGANARPALSITVLIAAGVTGLCLVPVFIFRLLRASTDIFSGRLLPKTMVLTVFFIGLCLSAMGLTAGYYFKVRYSYYLQFNGDTLFIKHGVTGDPFLNTEIVRFRMRLLPRDRSPRFPGGMVRGVQITTWPDNHKNEKAFTFMDRYIINPNKIHRLEQIIEKLDE